MKTLLIITAILIICLFLFFIMAIMKAGSDADDLMESYFNNPENFKDENRVRFTKTREEYYGEEA